MKEHSNKNKIKKKKEKKKGFSKRICVEQVKMKQYIILLFLVCMNSIVYLFLTVVSLSFTMIKKDIDLKSFVFSKKYILG